MAVLLVSGISGYLNAQTKENLYSNNFVGLKVLVPEGWYIATANETKNIMPDAARVMGLDDPAAKGSKCDQDLESEGLTESELQREEKL